MHETVIAEIRAQQLDYAARSKFVNPGTKIEETRTVLQRVEPQPAPPSTPAKSAKWLEMGSKNSFIEVG